MTWPSHLQRTADTKAIAGIHPWRASDAKVDRDGARLLLEVPLDTRSFTARLAGDPLPGRSALDKRQARNCSWVSAALASVGDPEGEAA